MIWLIDYAQSTSDELLSVVSESYPHLEKGAMRDFENIMKDRGYWNETRWNRTKHTYDFETGSKVEFFSVDTYEKAHGPRREVLFLNECQNLSWVIVDQLITRTKKIVWMDWNPTNEFYFYTEMLPYREKDIDFITLTYLDNEAISEVELQEIESHRHNKNWWDVYALGKLGTIEENIYREWLVNLDEIPHYARLERYGLDFGYSNDPTSIVAVYYYDGGYILDEICYQKGLSNKQISDILLNQRPALVVADSAEPKSIDEIHSYGVNIIATEKGADSVNNGIQLVQDQRISVTKRSVNIIKEYRSYKWERDKDGKILNIPEGIWNHAMDATRYAMSSIIKNPKFVMPEASPIMKGYYPELNL